MNRIWRSFFFNGLAFAFGFFFSCSELLLSEELLSQELLSEETSSEAELLSSACARSVVYDSKIKFATTSIFEWRTYMVFILLFRETIMAFRSLTPGGEKNCLRE